LVASLKVIVRTPSSESRVWVLFNSKEVAKVLTDRKWKRKEQIENN